MLNTILSKQRDKKMRLSKWLKLSKMPQFSEILWPSKTPKKKNKLKMLLLTPQVHPPERKLVKPKKMPSSERLR